jgi:isoquinoline 1-oxidoreductase alpha subunit
MMNKISVNGKDHSLVDVAESTPLLWVIRDNLKLKGTKFGCGAALCGACTVHMDGHPVRSCVTPVGTVSGKKITTIEAVSGKEADAIRAAWIKHDVPQCGYCQSGQIMSAIALLVVTPAPTRDDIDTAMSGNLCRCATYTRIRTAIADASEALR